MPHSRNETHRTRAWISGVAALPTILAGSLISPDPVSNRSPPNTTRYEENAATLTPGDAWVSIAGADAGATLSGGRGAHAAAVGAMASFSFNGTRVGWIGLPCEICGIAKVYLDGALAGTVDTFVPSRPAASRVLFAAGNLAAGSHTFTVQVTGMRNPSSGGASVLVDAFDVAGDLSGGGTRPARFEENAPSVAYTGSWEVQRRGDLSGGSLVESLNPNGTATMIFNGTGATWIGYRAAWGGIAKVYVDGVFRATVDTYSPVDQVRSVVYAVRGLPSGPHTFTIKVTGTWGSSGCCAWVALDGFDVTSAP